MLSVMGMIDVNVAKAQSAPRKLTLCPSCHDMCGKFNGNPVLQKIGGRPPKTEELIFTSTLDQKIRKVLCLAGTKCTAIFYGREAYNDNGNIISSPL
jgi:hypothetical protein